MRSLGEKDCETFHKFTAKGSFASERARQDVATAVSVSCTRVKSPGRNNWNKLVHMMKFCFRQRMMWRRSMHSVGFGI